jgi:hypothetical protein
VLITATTTTADVVALCLHSQRCASYHCLYYVQNDALETPDLDNVTKQNLEHYVSATPRVLLLNCASATSVTAVTDKQLL